jgi:hypothetical protein
MQFPGAKESADLVKVLPRGAGVAALALLGLVRLAGAATLEGQISFPGQSAPPMTAYVCEVETSRIRTIPLAPGQAHFAVEVPQGRYIVFLAPREPGAPDIYGAHTQDHGLAEVTLAGRTAHSLVTIDDWYLSDAVAAQLDHIRGIDTTSAGEPLAAPRFSEYRTATEAPAAPRPDFGEVTLAPEERARVLQAFAAAPTFAGSFSLVSLRCGSACERLLLLDWHSGRISLLPAPAEIRGPLPCRADEAIMFRRDSRLLGIHSLHADGVLTQYYVLKPDTGTLLPAAEYQRTPESFCATLPP